jgi:hypothetical protein
VHNSLDQFRFTTMSEMAQVRSFQEVWPHFRKAIIEILPSAPTGSDLFRLGDHLSQIFRSVPPRVAQRAVILDPTAMLDTDISGMQKTSNVAPEPTAGWQRTQSDVSAGGVTWECLVAWYLNLVCHGTEMMAARRRNSNTPAVIRDAVSVTLHGYSTTTEADLVVYSVPGLDSLADAVTIDRLNTLIERETNECSVAIIQCKTNWNDNAQIPMLWDLISRSLPFVQVSSAQLGKNGKTPRSFKNESIKYAFMTVPTNTRSKHQPGKVAVTRVLGLSGGNYWGHPSAEGVAAGFSEFLGRNFSLYFDGSIQNHLDRELAQTPRLLDRYLNLDFAPIPEAVGA